MGLAAAVGVGALGSVAGAVIQGNAAQQAAAEQASAAEQGIGAQEQMFNEAKGFLSPYVNAGDRSNSVLGKLLTPGRSANELAKMPGFQFQSQWGNLSTENALAAEGLGGSKGPLATGISQYNQGLAGTYYMNTVNALQNRVNTGAGAAGALASGATATGANLANTLGQLGSAQASGTLGVGNAISGGITGATGGIGNALLLSSLLGGGGNGTAGINGTLSGLNNSTWFS